MDNLRKSIEVIFNNTCSDLILQYLYSNGLEKDSFSKTGFLEQGLSLFNNYSFDEIENLYKKLDSDWLLDVYKGKSSKQSIFYLLTHFNKQVLIERDKEPFVCYEHLLRWRDLSFTLGEDLFTCSYFAYMDNRSKRKRNFFSWRTVAFSNNNRLKKLLDKGIAENHFHLKGSAPVFDLNWISLMNTINSNKHSEKFKKLKKEIKLNGVTSYSFHNQNKEIDILVYKASKIRLVLFQFLLEENSEVNVANFKYLLYPNSNKNDSFEVLMNLSNIQIEINEKKKLYGYEFYHKGNQEVADYAITKDMHINNFKGSFMMYGERQLLYNALKYIYAEKKESFTIEKLLHAYISIKNQFRSELIQINKKVGFANFSTYQDRKEYFIPDNSIYETALLQMAINDSTKFQNITSFETRIAPKNTALEINNSLKKYQINSDLKALKQTHYNIPIKKALGTYKANKEKHFYTVHFIKFKEKNTNYKLAQEVLPRHHQLRKDVKKQARAIVQLRESYSKKANLIRGIDAASSEFNARPEVFAQAFRYLKDHKLNGKYNHLKKEIVENKLYATYHAGEDFYDIIDGIRCIDETIKFLKFSQGDRIGHALALGIDVKEYFDFKGRKLLIPKEMLLDNIAWLLAKVRKYNINDHTSEIYKLEKLFDSLFREVYQCYFDKDSKFNDIHFKHDIYFDAWKLRGDDPYLYLEAINEKIEDIPNITYWERCRINHFYPTRGNIRNDSKTKFLYQQYHFNPAIKQKGKEIKQFEISDAYIKLVTSIQKEYQNYIVQMNIGIECNPTSNYLIGTIDKYSKHPIKNFFNLHLETDFEKIKECPQLFVSINTDDQGVFGTSLENEYALLAIAMEKEKDEKGNPKYSQTMIYEWLDKIREMGLEQSFKK
jgi:adenosine deaminase